MACFLRRPPRLLRPPDHHASHPLAILGRGRNFGSHALHENGMLTLTKNRTSFLQVDSGRAQVCCLSYEAVASRDSIAGPISAAFFSLPFSTPSFFNSFLIQLSSHT